MFGYDIRADAQRKFLESLTQDQIDAARKAYRARTLQEAKYAARDYVGALIERALLSGELRCRGVDIGVPPEDIELLEDAVSRIRQDMLWRSPRD